MKATLLVLAAWLGSRYGWLKQMDWFGPSGETILEYSVYDAIKAWFDHVVFVIREEFAEAFDKQIGSKIKGHAKVTYVYQSLDACVPDGFTTDHREKPWGTSHALLVAKDVVKTPFAVINADDRYGNHSYQQMMNYLNKYCDAQTCLMLGYVLRKTLSKHGSVNRGICQVDNSNNLLGVVEHLNISSHGDTTAIDGDGVVLPIDSIVSMNFRWFHPSIFSFLQEQFESFLSQYGEDSKREFFIPLLVDVFITEAEGDCKVFACKDDWCGVTNPEDKPHVQVKFTQMSEAWLYPSVLW